jgi:hypothetical protein
MRRPEKFETPGTLAIMLIYMSVFMLMWLLAFVYLASKWAIG